VTLGQRIVHIGKLSRMTHRICHVLAAKHCYSEW